MKSKLKEEHSFHGRTEFRQEPEHACSLGHFALKLKTVWVLRAFTAKLQQKRREK